MMQQAAFDEYAGHYDHHFTYSLIGQAQRRQVWQALASWLGGCRRILEANCGTGADALQLAARGHEVIATDVSETMIRICNRKKSATSGVRTPSFLRAGFGELSGTVGKEPICLFFSNFGGLNCIGPEDTRQLATALDSLLKADGRLFLVYMSRGCWWEQLYYRFKKKPATARRRKSEGSVQASIGGVQLPVWYYSPSEIRRLFAPYFNQEALYPIGLFTPPSYLESFFARHQQALRWLEKLDHFFGYPALANQADHFAIVLKKR